MGLDRRGNGERLKRGGERVKGWNKIRRNAQSNSGIFSAALTDRHRPHQPIIRSRRKNISPLPGRVACAFFPLQTSMVMRWLRSCNAPHAQCDKARSVIMANHALHWFGKRNQMEKSMSPCGTPTSTPSSQYKQRPCQTPQNRGHRLGKTVRISMPCLATFRFRERIFRLMID